MLKANTSEQEQKTEIAARFGRLILSGNILSYIDNKSEDNSYNLNKQNISMIETRATDHSIVICLNFVGIDGQGMKKSIAFKSEKEMKEAKEVLLKSL